MSALVVLWVWRVESTRWPVRTDWKAIFAVSGSRISPTMRVSGSCLSRARRAVAKVRPISLCVWTWVRPWMVHSMGSSTVMILRFL